VTRSLSAYLHKLLENPASAVAGFCVDYAFAGTESTGKMLGRREPSTVATRGTGKAIRSILVVDVLEVGTNT
jgi:hypothetical protein